VSTPATRRAAAGIIGFSGASLALTQAAAADASVNIDKVRADIASILDQDDYDDGSLGPVFIRLGWHASGTYSKEDGSGGSNGATMRFDPEAAHGANAGLDVARASLESIKKEHPGISYADLWTLAAVVAIEEMGGPKIPWRAGRVDKPDGTHCTPDGRLPDAAQGAQHLRDIFYRMGFNDQEIVALSGAHTFGRCHTDRSGFDGPWTFAPTTFSNLYFQELLGRNWVKRQWSGPEQYTNDDGKELMMLPTDMCLLEDPAFKKWVDVYAQDKEQFSKDFSAAFCKLTELGVPFKSWSPFVMMWALIGYATRYGA
jgi:cytochrome c peroxidase